MWFDDEVAFYEWEIRKGRILEGWRRRLNEWERFLNWIPGEGKEGSEIGGDHLELVSIISTEWLLDRDSTKDE